MSAPRVLPDALFRMLRAVVVAVLVCGAAQAQDVTLSVVGEPEDLTERLSSNALLLRSPEEGDGPRSGQDILAAARADYGRLIGILYEEGFFAPIISIRLDGREASDISPFAAPANVSTVLVTIDPGRPYRLGQAAFGPLATGTELPDGFAPGAPASTRVLQEATGAALDGWRDTGHATADVAGQRITARHPQAELDADIRIDPGPVVTFGTLVPRGQERMRVERIIEIAGLPTGDIYSPEALERAATRLRDTDVFSSVNLEIDDTLQPGNVADVVALVDERPLRRIGFGFEISSEDGAGVSAYWLHRNLFGGAERLRFDAEIAGLGQGDAVDGVDGIFSATFERPATFTADTTLGLNLTLFHLQEPQFTVSAVGIGAGLEHVINPNLTVSGGLGLVHSRIDDALGEREITRLTLPLGITYDSRDSALDARSGFFADATLTPFVTFDGGTGARLVFDGRTYLGLTRDDRTRVALRGQLGSVAGADLSEIPPDELFFSGGSGTVRGQDYQSLGVMRNGDVVGGRGFAGLSGELRHDIGDTNFGLAAFADAAYVSADAFGGGETDWHAGAGLGVRYQTPFGPIRVDLAAPVRGEADQQLYLYIGIGQAF